MNHATHVDDQAHGPEADGACRYLLVSAASKWRAEMAERLQGSPDPMVRWRHQAELIQITEPKSLVQLLEAHMAVPGRRVLILAGPMDDRLQHLVRDSGTEVAFADQVHFREGCSVDEAESVLQIADGDVVMDWLEAGGQQALRPIGPSAFAVLEVLAHEAWLRRFVQQYGADPFAVSHESDETEVDAPDPADLPGAVERLQPHRQAQQSAATARANTPANDEAFLIRAMAASAAAGVSLPGALSGEFIIGTNADEASSIPSWTLKPLREALDGSLDVQAVLTVPRAPALAGCTDFQIEFFRPNDLPWIVDLDASSDALEGAPAQVWRAVFNIARDDYASLQERRAHLNWRVPRKG